MRIDRINLCLYVLLGAIVIFIMSSIFYLEPSQKETQQKITNCQHQCFPNTVADIGLGTCTCNLNQVIK